MICSKHEIEMQLICYDYVCGYCYGENLLSEKIKAPKLTPMELVYEESSHRKVFKKKAFNAPVAQ